MASSYLGKDFSETCLVVSLSSEQIRNKERAISSFRSQMYNRKFLYSFLKPQEIFMHESSSLRLAENKLVNLGSLITPARKQIGQVFVQKRGEHLDITIRAGLIKTLERASIFLLGYRTDLEFSHMPKLEIGIREDRYKIYDKVRKIKSKRGASYRRERNQLEVTLPLKFCREPEKIFFHITLYSKSGEVLVLPWRILELI